MFVEARESSLSLIRENRTFYFCSEACRSEFAEPERQLRRLRWDLLIAWPFSLIVLLLTYGGFLSNPAPVALVLATVVQFVPGRRFYQGTLDSLRSRVWNMDLLIATATTVAYGYSVAAVAFPHVATGGTFFDASALILTLILTGYYLEHLTREKARGTLLGLRQLLPHTALVVRSGSEREVPISEVRVGDLCRIVPGGRIPTDGIVTEGRSTVDDAVLTGESLPLEKVPGSPVAAGAINGEGPLLVRATKVGADTSLGQIETLVEEAESSRVPLQRLADRIASRFVPFVLLVALAAALGWSLGGVGLSLGLLVFVSVAITACPCAFGIATPAAVMVGTGKAAREGILFKGRDSLFQASQIDTVLLDKTGTLTAGRPTLADLVPTAGGDRSALLAVAAGLERDSEHPYGRAIREAAIDRKLTASPFTKVEAIPGAGMRGELDGVVWSIQSGTTVAEPALRASGLSSAAGRLDSEAKSWSALVEGAAVRGLLGFSDEVRPAAREAIAALARQGVSIKMLTGDREPAARRVAEATGIREVLAQLTPAQKLEQIRELQRQGHRVAYVGDGINDAPALTAADLGVAIGSGTDVAKESGGALLVRSDLRGIAAALTAGRRTVRKVRQNLAWAVGYNAALLPIAAGALVPLFGLGIFRVLPVTGAIAMGLSSTTVLLNSLSLRWYRFSSPESPGVLPRQPATRP